MERIALIADLHGNMPAVEAVLEDIAGRQVSEIVVLGDLVGKGPYSDKVVDLIRSMPAQVIRGNWDEGMSWGEGDDPNFEWYKTQLGPERIKYLRELPIHYSFYMSGKYVRLFHSSADSLLHRVFPFSPKEELLGMFENHEFVGGPGQPEPDVVGYADIHMNFIMNFEGKTLFNTGSVGNPLDINQSSYVILEGDYHSTKPTGFSINFVRVPYDVEEAVRQAEESGMPYLEEFVRELRTARYRGRKD